MFKLIISKFPISLFLSLTQISSQDTSQNVCQDAEILYYITLSECRVPLIKFTMSGYNYIARPGLLLFK